MDRNKDDAWFAPKLFGWGVGLPIAWQGWALLAGFVAITLADMRWVTPYWLAVTLAVLFLLTFSVIAARHTRGGWRWRWGRE